MISQSCYKAGEKVLDFSFLSVVLVKDQGQFMFDIRHEFKAMH